MKADRQDSRVQDPLALDEIELYGELVIAASESAGPLSHGELDRVLGLAGSPEPPRGGSAQRSDVLQR